MVDWIESSLFADGKPLVFGAYFNGTRFATQWTTLERTDDAGFHVGLYLELDPTAVGQGGSILKQRAALTCDGDLNPLSYRSEAGGVRIGLEFSTDVVRATLADGTSREVPRGGADLVVEAYMFGLDALALALLHRRGLLTDSGRLVAFVVNTLMALPVELSVAPELGTPVEGRWFRSSQEEELLIRDDGVLLVSRMPAQGVEARREDPTPVPAWTHEKALAARVASYRPVENAAIRLEEVDVPAPVSAVGGTLSLPTGAGPFPAVLFISGSGTHDRHGISGEFDAGTHEILDQLAAGGLLGLRFDTRGAGRTLIGAQGLEPSLLGVLADAKAALDFLRGRPECDRERVFLVGHSQGGIAAMMIASEDPTLRGVALLATSARPVDELMLEQGERLADRLALPQTVRDARRQQLRDFVALVRSGATFQAGKVPDLMLSGASHLRWLKEHLENTGLDLIRRLRCPALICQGSKDALVSVERDAKVLYQAAQAAGVTAHLVVLDGLDHHFKSVGDAESTPALDFDPSRHVDRLLIDTLRSWLMQYSASPR